MRTVTAGRALVAVGAFAAWQAPLGSAGYTFVSLGNWGFGSAVQSQVAATLQKVAADERLALIVSPGSNFEGGVTDCDDDSWHALFSDVYADEAGSLKVPFFTVLGVEDWSGNYNCEVEMSEKVSNGIFGDQKIPQWSLPNWWYHYITHFQTGEDTGFLGGGHKDLSVGFIFIDTWILSKEFPDPGVHERAWDELKQMLEVAPAMLDYIIVVGDKPIFSSGSSRGDSYLAYYLLPLLKKADVDAYIAGYDFDMEVIEYNGLTQINCGNGAMSTALYASAEGSLFFSGEPGFCLHELTTSGMVTKFINGVTGDVLYTHNAPLKRRSGRASYDRVDYMKYLPPVEFVPVPEMTYMPTHETFIRIVGTLGIFAELVFLGLGGAVAASRIYKRYG